MIRDWIYAPACSHPLHEARLSDAAGIRAFLEAKAAALVARDAAALDAMIDPGFMYVNSRGSKFGKEEYVATYCRSGLIRFAEQTIGDVEVMAFDGFLVASMTIRDRFEERGEQKEGRYRSLGVFRKVGPRWLWVAGQTSSM